MPVRKLKEFLDGHRVKYVTFSHSPAFTAQEVAASAHISGRDLAKTVIIKIDGTMAMAVLPATEKLFCHFLQDATGATRVELATEREFQDRYPECELGAMPPFGNLYGMDVYVSDRLADHEEISFNAGTHTELMKLPYDDFERLVNPHVLALAYSDAALA